MNLANLNNQTGLEIAIIGMSGCFPDAQNIDEFWQNLRDGVESIHRFSDRELQNLGVDAALLNDPNYVKAEGFVKDIDLFDASFFDISPREAEVMDPSLRFFLEHSWKALEDAGYSCEMYKKPIGVYAGTSFGNYLLNIYSNYEIIASVGDRQIEKGNSPGYVTTLTSYKLNLQGPSYAVQTTCSSSLVAVHLACQSLLAGECNIALAGGVSISTADGYLYQEGGIESPDGHCRAFDAKAAGTVRGRGLGLVVLKRLEDAIADGDTIHAIIKGSAINNDGSDKVSYTAPSVNGQAKVIRAAQVMAEVEPDTISYIEAHGTGTTLGDPIEIAALTQAFRAKTQKKGFCGIGSVKTNIGHLDSAAGVAGLIKTVLALKHKQIPPSLNFDEPSPKIDFANSPFYVNDKLSEWKTNGTPRRAGVSSFGFGGTNAHVIIEEAPVIKSSSPSRPWQLLLLSAKTSTALETATENLVNYLKKHPDLQQFSDKYTTLADSVSPLNPRQFLLAGSRQDRTGSPNLGDFDPPSSPLGKGGHRGVGARGAKTAVNLADVAHTLQVGRWSLNHRRMVVCRDREDAIEALQDPQRTCTHYQEPCNRPVVFMFAGQGSQYVNMGRELYESEPTFREQVDRCCELLKPHLQLDLRTILYPSTEKATEATQQLQQTAITQPALFAIEYALAKLWMSWGVRPESAIGHSIGEYVAATLAGVFSLEDALAVVATRGKLMQQLPGGAMLSIKLPEKEMRQLLEKEISLAASNAPSSCVVSGSTEAIDRLQQKLQQLDVSCRRLHTSHAFHSGMMEPIIETFVQFLQKVKLNPPKIPFISNVSGTWITTSQATDPNYWAKHLRQPVRFCEGITELAKTPETLFLEIGPGRTLSTFVKQFQQQESLVLTSMRHPQEQQPDRAFLLNNLGKLWLLGVKVDWSGFYANERRHRIPLPTYPFERQRYWIEINRNATLAMKPQELTAKKLDIADWFYVPRWKQSMLPEFVQKEQLLEQKSCWLVFADTYGVGAEIVERLKQQGQDVMVVRIADNFAKLNDRTYVINPQQRDDYDALLQTLKEQNWNPQRIAHFWSVTSNDTLSGQEQEQFFEDCQNLGFYSLLFLTQALAKQNITESIELMVVTSNVHDVTGSENLCPEKATVLGPCNVIPQEFPNITCRCIDIAFSASENTRSQKSLDYLLTEFTAPVTDNLIAYRGNHRWIKTYEALHINENITSKTKLRKGGVYLVTGGLGRIGLAMSEYLAKTMQAKLVLIDRKDIPERSQWPQWLQTHDESNEVSQKLRKVIMFEELGAEVQVISADVANEEQMQSAITLASDRFGEIHGVIHAAGINNDVYYAIQETSTTQTRSQFHPKVYGLFVLEKVLRERQLDFCLLTSSSSSVLGGIGLTSYSAANIFMDAYARKQNQIDSFPCISVNWDTWQSGDDEKQDLTVGVSLEKLRMTPQEGIEVFSRILSVNTSGQIVVSTGELQPRIQKWIERKSLPNKQEQDNRNTPELSGKNPDLADWFYIPFWKPSLPPKELFSEKDCILIFIDECGLGSKLVEQLKAQERDVITVRIGEQFTLLSESEYTINSESDRDYDLLIQELCKQNRMPTTIAHCWNVTPNSNQELELENIDKAQTTGFYSLLFLAQALGKQEISDRVKISVISNDLQSVTGTENICPEKATLLGIVKVVSKESSNIDCRSIDVIFPLDNNCQEEKLIATLLAELTVSDSEKLIAYRGLHRWVQTFEPVRFEKTKSEKPRLREKGVYLITGGLGGIGLVLAEYLARNLQAKLLLIGRSTFPEKDDRDRWLATHDENNSTSIKIRKVRELERLGAEVLVMSADVSNTEQMQNAIARAQQQFGQLNGVIHAAGVPGGGLIQRKTQEEAEKILAAKVKGTVVIDSLVKDMQLDFFVLVSSNTSILGGFGQVDYCGANAFLDAFARRNASQQDTFIASINWSAWQEVGMTVNTEVPQHLQQSRTEELKQGILPDEGVDAFLRILDNTMPQVVVSPTDLLDALKQDNSYNKTQILEFLETANQSKSKYLRPQLSNDYVAPRNEVERTVAKIWQDILGIEFIGIYDNFFELGGDSLLAIQVISHLRKALSMDVPLHSLFDEPTIAGISQYIESVRGTAKQLIVFSSTALCEEEIEL